MKCFCASIFPCVHRREGGGGVVAPAIAALQANRRNLLFQPGFEYDADASSSAN